MDLGLWEEYKEVGDDLPGLGEITREGAARLGGRLTLITRTTDTPHFIAEVG